MESIFLIGIVLATFCGEIQLLPVEEEITTPPPPPRPYAFGYAAGRYPGHIDRTHSEVSDGSGVVQGSFSYVDPRHKIRTVQYIADRQGFHPVLNENVPDLPSDTPVVAAAKEKHLRKFAAIATAHQEGSNQAIVPVDTKAVEFAKNKHLSLYQQIAEEHARLAAETEALRKAEGINVSPNSLDHY
ncbi:cuticle protein 16.8 [Anoplophora glabripennis]|uniref:cuticle protein 16.8 n=1 Tax=Anoplophora glabripennis TaxID=217634 RepID=UPI0008735E6B|nr:cuticle protein 16.8 [Anoplophora glabripennis]